MSAEESATERFVWPPRAPEESAPQRSIAVARPRLLDVIETQFLGRVGTAFDERVRLEGWQVDERDAYCWRCGGSVGPHESDGEGCPACRRKRLPWERAIRLGAYAGPVRDAVLDLKFRGWRQTGRQLGRSLGKQLSVELERAQVRAEDVVMVPVPMHWLRRLRLGVDHTQVIASACAREADVRLCRALSRIGGPSQLEVPASDRRANVSRVFRRRNGLGLEAARLVVLVDDVRTTGATLRAASRALRISGDVERLWVATAGVTIALGRRETRVLDDSGGVDVQSVSIVSEIVEDENMC